MENRNPSYRGRGFAQAAFVVLAWLFVACVVVQTMLAGMAVFANPEHWSSHVIFVRFFEFLPFLMLIFSFAAKLPVPLRWQSFGLYAIIFIQYMTANLPGAGLLHPVIALFLFWFSVRIAKLGWQAR
ncbi:DUF6220 domain-containing protein [Paenibacillus harenae]|uniref:DUF2568 domain-containing protein n=1 Tax=Paenibacillus harenae TaxID=306543 RepID=A0ABT9U720_PAEHA|nr:DUF6220 domain-containing protein [Paenibacillus harenae]MDQ0115353.1 hypothetical protein [Paenibacillus harenae]